jgi:hypothetical protein
MVEGAAVVLQKKPLTLEVFRYHISRTSTIRRAMPQRRPRAKLTIAGVAPIVVKTNVGNKAQPLLFHNQYAKKQLNRFQNCENQANNQEKPLYCASES